LKGVLKMIKSIEELKFDDKMMGLINNAEIKFNQLAKEEGTETTMFEFIVDNLDNIEELEGLTDREKFMFSFSTMITTLQQRFS